MVAIWNKYANTAARKHGKLPRAAAKVDHHDAHTHTAIPQAVCAYIKPYLDVSDHAPLAHFASTGIKELNAKQEAAYPRMHGELRSALRHHGHDGRRCAVATPLPPQLYHTVALEYAVPAARMVNDGVAEFVAKYPDRFILMGTPLCRTAMSGL